MRELKKILRFLAVGLINTGFGYLSYVVFVTMGSPLWLAVAGSAVLAMIFNYLTYGGLVFSSISPRGIPKFLLVNLFVAVVNFVLLRLLTSNVIGPILAQAILLPVLAVLGYTGMRCFVFRQPDVMTNS